MKKSNTLQRRTNLFVEAVQESVMDRQSRLPAGRRKLRVGGMKPVLAGDTDAAILKKIAMDQRVCTANVPRIAGQRNGKRAACNKPRSEVPLLEDINFSDPLVQMAVGTNYVDRVVFGRHSQNGGKGRRSSNNKLSITNRTSNANRLVARVYDQALQFLSGL